MYRILCFLLLVLTWSGRLNTPTGGICHRTDQDLTYVSNEVVMAKVSSNAQLYCCIINSDFIGWVFLDNKISQNSKYSLTFDKNLGAEILTVNNVQESDSGSYFCRVNMNSKETRDFPVILNIRAQLLNQNPKHYLEISKTQRIPLNIIGTPFPTVQFFREGQETPLVQSLNTKQNIRNGRYEIVSSGDILIHNLQQSDTAKYVVRLIQGTNYVSDDYVIEVNVGARPFVAYVPKASYNFTLAQEETIPTRFSGSQLNIYWMFTSSISGVKADRIIGDINSHYFVSVDGALKVIGVERSDAGVYIGVCKNPWGEVQVKTSVTNIIRPAQILGLNNLVGTVSSNITLTVETTGDPPPFISWWRNGVKLNSTRVEVQKSSLNLQFLTRNDAGVYTVIADNGASLNGVRTYAYQNVTLFIEGLPSMDLKASTSQLVVTDNRKIIELRCVVNGLPISDIQFFKDTKAFQPNTITQGQKNTDRIEATLKLTIDSKDQTGNYVCVATNSFGTSTLNINVKYMVIPSPPINLRGFQLDRNFVKIIWDIGDSNDDKTDNVFLTMLWIGKNTVVASRYVTQQFAIFNTLTPGVQHYFSVRASNIAGWSNPSSTLMFKTPTVGRPSPPQILNRDIFLPTNSIRLYWTAPLDNGGDAVITYNIRMCTWDTDRIYLDKNCEQFTGVRSNEIYFTGLLAYQLYNFYVVAQNQIDKSEETRFQVFSGPNAIIASPGPTSPEWIVFITIFITLFVIFLIDLLLFFIFRTGLIYWFFISCLFYRKCESDEKIPLNKKNGMPGVLMTDSYPKQSYQPIQQQDIELAKKKKLYIEDQSFQEIIDEEKSDIRMTEILQRELNEKPRVAPVRLENYKYTVSEKNEPQSSLDRSFVSAQSGDNNLKAKSEAKMEETIMLGRRRADNKNIPQTNENKMKKRMGEAVSEHLPVDIQDNSEFIRRMNVNPKKLITSVTDMQDSTNEGFDKMYNSGSLGEGISRRRILEIPKQSQTENSETVNEESFLKKVTKSGKTDKSPDFENEFLIQKVNNKDKKSNKDMNNMII